MHIPHYTRLMDEETSNKRLLKTTVRILPYRGSNVLCEPSSANHELCCNQPPQTLRNRDTEGNAQRPSSLSTLTIEKLTKAKSSNLYHKTIGPTSLVTN